MIKPADKALRERKQFLKGLIELKKYKQPSSCLISISVTFFERNPLIIRRVVNLKYLVEFAAD